MWSKITRHWILFFRSPLILLHFVLCLCIWCCVVQKFRHYISHTWMLVRSSVAFFVFVAGCGVYRDASLKSKATHWPRARHRRATTHTKSYSQALLEKWIKFVAESASFPHTSHMAGQVGSLSVRALFSPRAKFNLAESPSFVCLFCEPPSDQAAAFCIWSSPDCLSWIWYRTTQNGIDCSKTHNTRLSLLASRPIIGYSSSRPLIKSLNITRVSCGKSHN